MCRLDDRELIRLHRGGDRRARATLIERYLPRARTLALRYRRSGEPLEDLIQVASLGLVKAADRWNPARGCAFSSLAVPTILGELRHYFRDATWAVRPPRGLAELSRAIEQARGTLDVTLGREPTTQDLADHLGRTPEAIAAATRAAGFRWLGSLEQSGDTVGAQDRDFEHAEGRVMFEHLTRGLEPRARAILRLSIQDDLPQHRIAPLVGCSQVHVSRVMSASLQALSTR
jgi:RNA polymerase sigma-B factor